MAMAVSLLAAGGNEALLAAMAEQRVPGMQLVVLEAGAPGPTASFGERAAGEAVTEDTVFEVASLGKPVLAYLVHLLIDDGLLAADDRLAALAPITAGADPGLAEITVAQALSHTSGLGNGLYLGPGTALEHPPGSTWRYSGAAYLWLQRAVEEVTGEPLDAVMQRRVFAPLAMDHSRYTWRGDLRAVAATGHDEQGAPQPKWQPAQAVAPASLHTTAADYARFLAAVWASPDAQRAPLVTPQVAAVPELGIAWADGFAVQQEQVGGRSVRSIFHWGANPHFRAFALLEVESGRGLVMLTNGSAGLELVDEVALQLLGRVPPLTRFQLLHPVD